MLNSERIFSDSRTLNAIEDTFFRRAMAIYCENESKKVMSELEASDTEPKRSAAPVSRIFAKLRRQSGFSNAFRIAKKITDRVALSWTMPEHTDAQLAEQLRQLTRGTAEMAVSAPFYAPF